MDTVNNFLERDRRLFQKASSLSKASNAPNFKIGAVIAKGRTIIGQGWNDIVKTHPSSRTMGQYIHAELSAILDVKDKEELRGASIYVYRGTLRPLISKPCKHCHALLQKVGIKYMFYTTTDGFQKESVFP